MLHPIHRKVQLFKINYDEREYNAVPETLKFGWITMGQRTVDSLHAHRLARKSKALRCQRTIFWA